MGSVIGDVLRYLEECGVADFEGFITLDAGESGLWCCWNPEMREEPCPVDTQVKWLKGEYRGRDLPRLHTLGEYHKFIKTVLINCDGPVKSRKPDSLVKNPGYGAQISAA